MRKSSAFIQPFDQLPDTLPVFPLSNAVVLPGGELPLNIFEPRYLNMVQDAMKTQHLIGMIQPRDDSSVPELYNVGCAGRITRYAETSDGRIEIVLSGVCRYRVSEELKTARGYRLVVPDWSDYQGDYESQQVQQDDIWRFKLALRHYFERHNIDIDWDMLDKLDIETLANSLVGALTLRPEDKQLLLEAANIEQRVSVFMAILDTEQDAPAQRH
jgi:Lon protease-like protein